jgi:hypothetical protein
MDTFSSHMWAKARKLGKAKFIVLAALAHSALACLIYVSILELFAIDNSPLFTFAVLTVLVCFGPLWSYSFWVRMEKAWAASERGHRRERA